MFGEFLVVYYWQLEMREEYGFQVDNLGLNFYFVFLRLWDRKEVI